MVKGIYKLLAVLSIIVLGGFINSDSDIYFRMSKAIDIYGRVYKEVALNYVDEVDPEPFMLQGINGMLDALDPYTVYIDEKHQKDIELITKGKYGGIGATVGLYNDKITIVDLIEGYSAQRQGIRIGDVIKKVDSILITKDNYDELGNYLKREPGTEISLTVEREGVKGDIIFNLVSEEIEIKNLTFYGFVPENSNNVYMKLSSFSRSAGEEIRKALHELKIQKDVNSIILDLRGNPGGLLDAAIDVSEKFLSKGQKVVSIKGRDELKEQIFNAQEEPIAGKAKLILLVDNGSASASEIVAGAIQDHDRGVILGTKSYGKGLVQTVIPLSFNTSLKMTTARYYTPSGRCIQEIDYSNEKEIFGNNVNDDDKLFFTDNKREVHGKGGIMPDTVVVNSSESHLVRSLLAKGMFFKFATNYFNTSTNVNTSSSNDDNLFKAFEKYLENEDFNYQTQSEFLISELKESIKKEGYNSNLIDEVSKLDLKFDDVKKKELNKYKSDIISEIKQELSARNEGRKGRITESLKYDNQFATALEILNKNKVFNNLLSIKN